jgi:hypothetical protein
MDTVTQVTCRFISPSSTSPPPPPPISSNNKMMDSYDRSPMISWGDSHKDTPALYSNGLPFFTLVSSANHTKRYLLSEIFIHNSIGYLLRFLPVDYISLTSEVALNLIWFSPVYEIEYLKLVPVTWHNLNFKESKINLNDSYMTVMLVAKELARHVFMSWYNKLTRRTNILEKD